MLTIELSVTPLSPKPVPCEEWRSACPDYLSAYDKTSEAEHHAVQQILPPYICQVTGYLFVELSIDVQFSLTALMHHS